MGLLDKIRPDPLVALTVEVGDLRLRVQVPEGVVDQVRASALRRWEQIESYMMRNSSFREATGPVPIDPDAPPIVNSMSEASRSVGTRPIEALPGAIAEAVARDLEFASKDALVTCEGSTFVVGGRPRVFRLDHPEAGDLGLRVASKEPYGVYCSTGRVRVSPVIGRARAIAVVASEGALADAVGTAMGAALAKSDRLKGVLAVAQQVRGVIGGMVFTQRGTGVWGDIEVVGTVGVSPVEG